jgi:hypothetical protein
MNLNRFRTKHRGSGLVTAMLFALIASILGISMLGMSATGSRLSVHRRDRERAFQLAEAGLQHALVKLGENDSYTGQTNVSFGEGTFRIAITPRAGEPGRRDVVSTGRILSHTGGHVERSVKAIVGWTKPHPAWNYTIFSHYTMSLAERTAVDSLTAPGAAQIHSNGTITLGVDHLHVYGNASATTAVVAPNPSVVTGEIQNLAAAADYPPFNRVTLLEQAEAKGTSVGDFEATSGAHILKGKIVGNVTIGGSADVTIEGPLWITGNLTISGKSWTGGGAMIAEGKIHIQVSYVVNGTVPNDLALVSLSSAPDAVFIDTRDNSDKINVFGGVFAPHGGVTVHGKTSIRGGVIGRTVTIDGKGDGVDIVRDATQRAAVAVLPEVYHWSEL